MFNTVLNIVILAVIIALIILALLIVAPTECRMKQTVHTFRGRRKLGLG